MHICDLKEKKISQKFFDFEFPRYKAFCHVMKDYFLAGGWKMMTYKQSIYFNNLWRITFNAEIHQLNPMLSKKCFFPMIYFKINHSLITLGGRKGSGRLKEVTEYSLRHNVWITLPCFPFGVWNSSICILNNEWLYNLGGEGSKWSFGKLALTGSSQANNNQWKEVKLINNQ